MTHNTIATLSRLLVALALMLSAFALVEAVQGVEAEAYCSGEGNAMKRTSGSRGTETVQATTTCDGLTDYYGKTIDDHEDGYCIVADYKNAGGFDLAKNCPNSVWLNYSFDDTDQISQFRMCRYHPSNGTLHNCTEYWNSFGY